MNGHVRKRGSLWEVVLELGEQSAQRCPVCVDARGRGRRYWTDKGRLTACPTCGSEMGDIRPRAARLCCPIASARRSRPRKPSRAS